MKQMRLAPEARRVVTLFEAHKSPHSTSQLLPYPYVTVRRREPDKTASGKYRETTVDHYPSEQVQGSLQEFVEKVVPAPGKYVAVLKLASKKNIRRTIRVEESGREE